MATTSATNNEPQTQNNSSDENLDNLAGDIESTLRFVQSSRRPAAQDCIIRSVNPLLRRVNEAAYRPLFIIIGPLRCYNSLLEPMELQKRIYLASFLQRFSSLWRSVATLAATALLLLTLTQTICAIIAL